MRASRDGADRERKMMDFARAILVRLDQKKVSPKTRATWEKMMFEFLDAAQLAIDRKKLASQVHVVFRKRAPG